MAASAIFRASPFRVSDGSVKSKTAFLASSSVAFQERCVTWRSRNSWLGRDKYIDVRDTLMVFPAMCAARAVVGLLDVGALLIWIYNTRTHQRAR
jgi:hypothetical protein